MSKRSKRRQKRILCLCVIAIAIALIFGLVGFMVSRKADDADLILANTANSNQASSQDGSQEDDNYLLDESAEDLSVSGITFDELSKYYFSFCSGAGGWSDDFSIEKDGYFHGNYHDSDMGDMGDDYPNGTIYFCQYEGHFADIEKVDEYTCKMKMTDIKILNDEQEYIEDGTKFVPLAPYALSNADEVDIYLPGKPVSEIPQEVQEWLGIAYMEDKPEKLDSIALVNVNENQGITTYERMSAKEEAQSSYDATKNSYEYYGKKLTEAETTVEMVEITGSQVKVTDDCLNDIWRTIKYNTDEATFNKALEKQRQWLKDRDAKAEKASAEYEGGTFAPVAYNDTFASMTLDRCKDLLKYLN